MILVLHALNSLLQIWRFRYANNDDDWVVLLQGKQSFLPITIVYNKRGGKNGKQSIFKYVNHSGHFPSPELKNGNVKRLHFNFQRIPFFTHYSIIFVFFPLWFSVLSAKKSVFNDGEKADATPDSRRQSVSQSIWVLVLECELFTICRNCWNSIFTTLRLMLMCLVSWP